MSKTSRSDDLLRCIFHVIARAAIAENRVLENIGTGAKQIKAYNLCNGSYSQMEIANKSKLDPGNFNRTLTRWTTAGIVYIIGDGRDAKLLHVYPISKAGKQRQTLR